MDARWRSGPTFGLRPAAGRGPERRCGAAAEPCIIDCKAAAEVGGARRRLARSPAASGTALRDAFPLMWKESSVSLFSHSWEYRVSSGGRIIFVSRSRCEQRLQRIATALLEGHRLLN